MTCHKKYILKKANDEILDCDGIFFTKSHICCSDVWWLTRMTIMQADLRYKRASKPLGSLDHNPIVDLAVICHGVFW